LIDPRMCRSCGATHDLTRWRECDEWDKPTMAIVVLCRKCSKRLIDKHPRLYLELALHEPFPGTMQICVDCPARSGLGCMSRLAKHNGGPGMKITGPMPTVAFICCSPRSKSGTVKLYPGEATDCVGKQDTFRPRLVE
jgi:hypothetical protein